MDLSTRESHRERVWRHHMSASDPFVYHVLATVCMKFQSFLRVMKGCRTCRRFSDWTSRLRSAACVLIANSTSVESLGAMSQTFKLIPTVPRYGVAAA